MNICSSEEISVVILTYVHYILCSTFIPPAITFSFSFFNLLSSLRDYQDILFLNTNLKQHILNVLPVSIINKIRPSNYNSGVYKHTKY